MKDYLAAVRNYSYEGIESGLLLLHAYNLKSVGSRKRRRGRRLLVKGTGGKDYGLSVDGPMGESTYQCVDLIFRNGRPEA